MSRFVRQKFIAGVVASLLASHSSVQASPDTSAAIDVLAMSLGVELSDVALDSPQGPLGTAFRNQFRSRASLTSSAIRQYFKDHPSELLAFRTYSQTLHNSGFLSYNETVALVKSVVIGFSENTGSVPSKPGGSVQILNDLPQTKVTTSRSASEIAVNDAVAEAPPNELESNSPRIYSFGAEIQNTQDEAAKQEAARIMAELEAEKKRKRLEAQAAFLMQQLAQSGNPKQTLLERVNSILNQHTQQVVQKKADEVFENAEISITSTEQGPEFNARVLKAFDPNPNDGFFNYGELGLVDIDDRQTLNAGFGIRALDPSERVMYGANIFFDQEFPHNHQRASFGIEMATSPFRFNANRYYALSTGKGLSGDITERALSGQDIKTKIAFPYLPNLFLDYSKFKWFGKDGLADVKGQTVGVSGALSDSLSIEIARKVYSTNNYTSENSARLTYRYTPGSEKSANIFTPMAVPYALEKLDAREKYAMTNRENEIQKQQTSPGLQVTFTSL